MKPIVPRPVVNRRILLSGLAAPVLLSGLHLTAQARLPESPLASWNDGPTKQAILDFVHDREYIQSMSAYPRKRTWPSAIATSKSGLMHCNKQLPVRSPRRRGEEDNTCGAPTPQKRTFGGSIGMSALCHKRTDRRSVQSLNPNISAVTASRMANHDDIIQTGFP
jgi:hypothetical protein